MRLLVTRPRSEGEALALRLREVGIETCLEPMLDLVPLPHPPLDLKGVQGVLLTSRGAVRALADATPNRVLALFAVGDATAGAARQLGFGDVRSADGDADALAKLVCTEVDPARGALLHVRGARTAGDLAGDLTASGFTVREAVLYESRPAAQLSTGCADALRSDALDGALFFSPRSAETFVNLARMAGLEATAARLDAYCFSDAVAKAAAGLGWRRVIVSPSPDLDAMIGLLVPETAR